MFVLLVLVWIPDCYSFNFLLELKKNLYLRASFSVMLAGPKCNPSDLSRDKNEREANDQDFL